MHSLWRLENWHRYQHENIMEVPAPDQCSPGLKSRYTICSHSGNLAAPCTKRKSCSSNIAHISRICIPTTVDLPLFLFAFCLHFGLWSLTLSPQLGNWGALGPLEWLIWKSTKILSPLPFRRALPFVLLGLDQNGGLVSSSSGIYRSYRGTATLITDQRFVF